MRRFALVLLAIALLGAWSPGCNPQPQPVPPPAPTPSAQDGGKPPPPPFDGDVYDRACAVELYLGCPEGNDPKCASSMRSVANAKLTFVPAPCIAAAKTKADVRACGSFAPCK